MATTKKTVKKEDATKKDTTKKKTTTAKKDELIDTPVEKEEVKKTTAKKTTTKTNSTKAKKTNTTKKTETPSVVDEFLNENIGKTLTEKDEVKKEKKTTKTKAKKEKKEEVKESVADMYEQQAAELIKEAAENEPECFHHIDAEEELTQFLTEQIKAEAAKLSPEIDTNENKTDTNDDTNNEPNDEPDYEKEVLDNLNNEVDKYCEESRQKIVGEVFKLGMNVSGLDEKYDKVEIDGEDKFKELFDRINELANKGPEATREQENKQINVNLDTLKCKLDEKERETEKLKDNNKNQLNKLSIVYVNSAMGASWD